MSGFTVHNAMTDALIGTVTYDGNSWSYSRPSLAGMVEGKLGQGLTPQQVLDFYAAWGNQGVYTKALTS
jgi:hypothetical protein